VHITVKGRNFLVTDELRDCVTRRFERVAKQVSDRATLEVELSGERNPGIAHGCVAEATLQLKGVTLRAREASPDMKRSIGLIADDMAVQTKRHRDRRRKRRESRAAAEEFGAMTVVPGLDTPGEASAEL
jgi:putative sigma-54 modulation protein